MEPKSNRNEALEALDFIINVLKEHEKDLDRLIGQLGNITESLSETGEISEKINNIENRISNLQSELTMMIKNITIPKIVSTNPNAAANSVVNVKCKKWEDFKALAIGAETILYSYKTSEDTYNATALKDGKTVSYTGDLPANSILLKIWLSQQLGVKGETVFEGSLNNS